MNKKNKLLKLFKLGLLLEVIDGLTSDDSGKFYAWKGEEIQP